MTVNLSTSITAAEVHAAAGRLAGVAPRTPVLTCPDLDRRAAAQVVVKGENLQRTGSFKFRGAFNALALLTAEQRARGMIAFSSGNHALAVAEAAALLGTTALW